MSCNPAIAGLRRDTCKGNRRSGRRDGQGHRRDRHSIQAAQHGQGSAVRSSRAQVDRQQYRLRMKKALEDQEGLTLRQATVEEILLGGNQVTGIRTHLGEEIRTRALILATGTFSTASSTSVSPGFRRGGWEIHLRSGLSETLKGFGFRVGRLKTGPLRGSTATPSVSKGFSPAGR